jgi:hypothetical protein
MTNPNYPASTITIGDLFVAFAMSGLCAREAGDIDAPWLAASAIAIADAQMAALNASEASAQPAPPAPPTETDEQFVMRWASRFGCEIGITHHGKWRTQVMRRADSEIIADSLSALAAALREKGVK